MVRVKICGMTHPRDAAAAAELGADAIGLVFARSPRQVSLATARQIIAALPPWIARVGVFVNPSAATVRRAIESVGISEVQLHGDEAPGLMKALGGMPVIKALRVRDRSFTEDVGRWSDAGAAGILLDAYSPKARGGTGERFDWDLVTQNRRSVGLDKGPPLILAGGLNVQNIRAAIRAVRPWGVDVSSGVESKPGVKSVELMERFISAARSA
ncbi:MAG TPA: phosphoribosylanthranilate isomerase [Phycisphaerae bacterium]|nr:phosphoribosylanthranilate isomerase [Phycisphaerae bacterium]